MGEKLFTATQLGEIFGKSRQTIHNWIIDNRFPNYQEVGEGGGKIIVVPASDVEAVIEAEAAKLHLKLAKLNGHKAALGTNGSST